jgi:hypothetical protein
MVKGAEVFWTKLFVMARVAVTVHELPALPEADKVPFSIEHEAVPELATLKESSPSEPPEACSAIGVR